MDEIPSVSYAADIKPIMLRSCTPCHFPERGRKEMLDTYEKTKNFIDDILLRVQLSPEDRDYMPFKQKRPALSDSEIQLFKDWRAQGLPE